jgi:hypothetical protein
VQAGDLGLVVPLAILSGALLLRRRPVGYLLASVLLVKGATFGLALVAVALICCVGTLHLFHSLPGRPEMASVSN